MRFTFRGSRCARGSRRPRARLSLAVLAGGLAAGACGGGDAGAPAVYFVQPSDGETLTSPVTVIMGVRNIDISPVPEEVDEPRPEMVHGGDVGTVVTLELHERDGATEVILHHEGFPEEAQATEHTKGWTSILERLAAQY